MKKTAKIISIIHAIMLGCIIIYAAKAITIASLVKLIVIFLWAIGPQFLLLLFISKTSKPRAIRAFYILQWIQAIATMFLYVYGFVIYNGLVNGLLFVLGPLWQYVLVIALGLLILAIHLLTKSNRT